MHGLTLTVTLARLMCRVLFYCSKSGVGQSPLPVKCRRLEGKSFSTPSLGMSSKLIMGTKANISHNPAPPHLLHTHTCTPSKLFRCKRWQGYRLDRCLFFNQNNFTGATWMKNVDVHSNLHESIYTGCLT